MHDSPHRLFLFLCCLSYQAHGAVPDTDDESQLLIDLFGGYQSLTRPLRNQSTGPVHVRMGMQLVHLVEIDERDQIMHTNVWLTLKWKDEFLQWDPARYGGIRLVRVPKSKVWMPDIVLFNNADGEYQVTYSSNAMVWYDGQVAWVPPALLRSTCIMNVEHFPFDDQECPMFFKSWTYNRDEVRLGLRTNIAGVDLSQYVANYAWDIEDAPACVGNPKGPKPDDNGLTFVVRLRRKTLFYTVILIMPCVMMGMCTAMVFYLPTAAGEKIGMSIYILLSITVFLNLLSKILPPTADSIPLLGKYVILIFVLNIVTILMSVMIVNVHFRSPHTVILPNWVKWLFIKFLARVLLMKRPSTTPLVFSLTAAVKTSMFDRKVSTYAALKEALQMMKTGEAASKIVTISGPKRGSTPVRLDYKHHPDCEADGSARGRDSRSSRGSSASTYDPNVPRTKKSKFCDIPPSGMVAIRNIEYITDHLKRTEDVKKVREDWHYVSMVIDRILLYIFAGITVGATMGMFLNANNVFSHSDQANTIKRLSIVYGWKYVRNYMNAQ